jgi:hypothetical protein
MNYCIVAFGVILLISCTTWIVDGRKHYKGPKVDIYAMLEGKTAGDGGDPMFQPESGTHEKAHVEGPSAGSDF